MVRTIEEIEAAIQDTTSMINKRKSDLADYEDEYNRASRNGDEDMADYWKSQMRYAQNRIDELEGVLADEQAELKSAQAAGNTDDSGSNSTTGGGSTDSTDDSGSNSATNGGSTDSTDDDGGSNSTVNGGFANHYVYEGGDQVISDYAGQAILLDTTPMDAFFGGGNFALISETGTLLIQNANDKIISFTDDEGNPYAKAYAATNPGVIDGRGLAGYEVITGSDLGGDVIFAGDDGSRLWGGNGFVADILTGGDGEDIFVSGKYEGSDSIVNASSDDTVFLRDVTLSDIALTASDGYNVGIMFNTGNVLTVTGTSEYSANFMLADGTEFKYNYSSKQWFQDN